MSDEARGDLEGFPSAHWPGLDAGDGHEERYSGTNHGEAAAGGIADDAFQLMMDDSTFQDFANIDLDALTLNADVGAEGEEGETDILAELGLASGLDELLPPASLPADPAIVSGMAAPATQDSGTAPGESPAPGRADGEPADLPASDAGASHFTDPGLEALQPALRPVVLSALATHISNMVKQHGEMVARGVPAPHVAPLGHAIAHHRMWYDAIGRGAFVPPHFVPPGHAPPQYPAMYAAEMERAARRAGPPGPGNAQMQMHQQQVQMQQRMQMQRQMQMQMQAQMQQRMQMQSQQPAGQADGQLESRRAGLSDQEAEERARAERIQRLHVASMGGQRRVEALEAIRPSKRMGTRDIISTISRVTGVQTSTAPFEDDFYNTITRHRRQVTSARPGVDANPTGGGSALAQIMGSGNVARTRRPSEAVSVFLAASRENRRRAAAERATEKSADGDEGAGEGVDTSGANAGVSFAARVEKNVAARAHRERDWQRISGALGSAPRPSLLKPAQSLSVARGTLTGVSSLKENPTALLWARIEAGLSAVVRLEANAMGEAIPPVEAEALARAVGTALGAGTEIADGREHLQEMSQTRRGKRLIARGIRFVRTVDRQSVLQAMLDGLLFVVCSAEESEEMDELNHRCSQALVEAFGPNAMGQPSLSPELYAHCLGVFVDAQTRETANTLIHFGPSADVVESLLATGGQACGGGVAPKAARDAWESGMERLRQLTA